MVPFLSARLNAFIADQSSGLEFGWRERVDEGVGVGPKKFSVQKVVFAWLW